MTTFLTIVHVCVCVFLVSVVLLQSGRAGGMGILSGAATQTVFGGRGASGFLAKATSVCATLFMLTSASLAYVSTSGRDSLARANRNRPAVTTPARPATAPTKNAPATPPAPAPTPAPSTDNAPAPTTAPTAPAAPTAPTAPGNANTAPTAPTAPAPTAPAH